MFSMAINGTVAEIFLQKAEHVGAREKDEASTK